MSAEPITPSTAEVRADYILDHTRNFDSFQVGRSLTSEQEFYAAKFDQWLREERAKVLRKAEDVAADALRAWWTAETRPEDDTDSVMEVRRAIRALRNEGNTDD